MTTFSRNISLLPEVPSDVSRLLLCPPKTDPPLTGRLTVAIHRRSRTVPRKGHWIQRRTAPQNYVSYGILNLGSLKSFSRRSRLHKSENAIMVLLQLPCDWRGAIWIQPEECCLQRPIAFRTWRMRYICDHCFFVASQRFFDLSIKSFQHVESFSCLNQKNDLLINKLWLFSRTMPVSLEISNNVILVFVFLHF